MQSRRRLLDKNCDRNARDEFLLLEPEGAAICGRRQHYKQAACDRRRRKGASIPKPELVTKVWIAPGCIVCDACETTCPDVFEVQHDNDTCIIRPAALDMEFTKLRTKDIIQAAEECPVDVIKFDLAPVEVSEEEARAFNSTSTAQVAAHASTGATVKPTDAAVSEAKSSPSKNLEALKVRVSDPAIQALLAATMARGGRVVIDKDVKPLPESVRRIAALPPAQLPADARYQRVLARTREKKPELARRDIVLTIGWTATALTFGILPAGAFVRFMAPNVLEEPDPIVRCGPLSKYRAMEPGAVNEDFKPVKPTGFWLIRERDEDRIAALSIVCTHLGCIPNWLPNDQKFKCPCHGSGYKQDGTNFEGPSPRPLERYKIYVDGEEVVVDRSKKFLAMGPMDTAIWNDPDSYIQV